MYIKYIGFLHTFFIHFLNKVCRKGVVYHAHEKSKMTETVIIALLSFAGTALGTITGIVTSNRLTTYRITELEKKVDKHNSVIDRTYKLEEATAILECRMKDLEREGK